MNGLCGWFNYKHSRSVDPQTLATMGASLSRFGGGTVRSASAGFGAVAGIDADLDIFQDDQRLVVVSGRAYFVDAKLAGLARQHGVAHALAEGYARKGSNVLATLSGAFAVAILD